MPNNDDIKRFRETYDAADCFAREVGELRERVSIPAHNELRYAGHHLLESINEDGVVVDDALLQKALSHCQRAMYEAAEAGIAALLKGINTFRIDYRNQVVSEVVPKYAEILSAARNAQDTLARGREDRTTIQDHVDEYMTIFRGLRKMSEVLEASRDDLNAVKRREFHAFWRYALMTAASVLGAIFMGWRILLMYQ